MTAQAASPIPGDDNSNAQRGYDSKTFSRNLHVLFLHSYVTYRPFGWSSSFKANMCVPQLGHFLPLAMTPPRCWLLGKVTNQFANLRVPLPKSCTDSIDGSVGGECVSARPFRCWRHDILVEYLGLRRRPGVPPGAPNGIWRFVVSARSLAQGRLNNRRERRPSACSGPPHLRIHDSVRQPSDGIVGVATAPPGYSRPEHYEPPPGSEAGSLSSRYDARRTSNSRAESRSPAN